MTDRLAKHYGDTHRGAWALKVFNILHDIHLEHWQAEDFPTLVPVFVFKGLYFARPWGLDLSRPQTRYGALINATLYPHATDWAVSPEGLAFKEWADDWAKRAKAKSARQTKTAIALIDEALAFLRYDEVIEPPPEDGHGGAGEPDDESEDEGEDDDGDGTAGTGDDDFDEDDDEMRTGDDEGSGAPPEHDPDGEKAEPSDEGEDEDGSGTGDDESDGDETDSGSTSSGSKAGETGEDVGDDGTGTAGDDESDIHRSIDEGDTTDGTEDQPLPSLHGDMHTSDDASWQDAIDSYRSTQAAGRDKFVVGGGEVFAYREVRIIRAK
jgi:hypothetical protein